MPDSLPDHQPESRKEASDDLAEENVVRPNNVHDLGVSENRQGFFICECGASYERCHWYLEHCLKCPIAIICEKCYNTFASKKVLNQHISTVKKF